MIFMGMFCCLFGTNDYKWKAIHNKPSHPYSVPAIKKPAMAGFQKILSQFSP